MVSCAAISIARSWSGVVSVPSGSTYWLRSSSGSTASAQRSGPPLGTFAAPFEEDLFFGKLSWQPAEGHLVDWSVTYRDEVDIRDFGGVNTFDRAINLAQDTLTSNLRWQWQGAG